LAGGHRLCGRSAAGTFFDHRFLDVPITITLGGLVAVGVCRRSVRGKDLRVSQTGSSYFLLAKNDDYNDFSRGSQSAFLVFPAI
jgi:hypothetical protein